MTTVISAANAATASASTVAVLPVKRFARAKQRLRAAVDGIARERLASAMVADVLEVITALDELVRVVVVTATLMADAATRERVARETLDFALALAR